MDRIDRLLKVAAEAVPRPNAYDFSRLTTDELKEIVKGTSDERLEILVEKIRKQTDRQEAVKWHRSG